MNDSDSLRKLEEEKRIMSRKRKRNNVKRENEEKWLTV
jgi:hypothetical protein